MIKASELMVITKSKDLCTYILTVTKKSPKYFRFTLVSRMHNLALDIIENIYIANEIFTKSQDIEMKHKRLDFQQKALTDVKVLSYIVLLSCEQGCILPKQYEQMTKLCYDCQCLIGAWIKSDKKEKISN